MTALVGIVAGLLVAIILIRVFENRLIFFPPRDPGGVANPALYGLPVEEVWLTTADGIKLNAWCAPAPASAQVLLVFHGNAENLPYSLDRLRVLAKLGVNLFEVDYRGYGKSQGSPDEQGVYRDAEAAYGYLTGVRKFQPHDVIVYGQSLGGAVAIDLASHRACGGLIVESSFTSVRDMARRVFRIPFFEYVPKSRFDSISKIAKVRCPVLILHGKQDDIIPFAMGEALYHAAPSPKNFLPVEGAGHNDVFVVGGEKYLASMKELVGSTMVR